MCNFYEIIDDTIQEIARRVRVEGSVNKCKHILKNCIEKIDSLIGLASKVEKAEKLQSELEK